MEDVEKEVLKALVEENRKFRKEIMKILYGLIVGLCVTVFVVVVGWISITHIYFYSPSDYTLESKAINTNTNINTNNNTNEKVDSTEIDYNKKGSDK